MKTKTLLLSILLGIVVTSGLVAQEENYEIGIRISDFSQFGGFIKVKNQKGNFQRIRVATGNIGYYPTSNNQSTLRVSGVFAYGIEKRKNLTETLLFIRGFEPFIDLGVNISDNLFVNSRFGLGYVLGLQYNFTNNFSVSLECIPSISTIVNFNEPYNFNINLEGSTSLVSLAFVHRFYYSR